MTVVDWETAADWDLFTPHDVNTSTNTLTLGATDGEGTIDGGSGGDGNDRRVFVLDGFSATDVDVRLDFRLTGSPSAQSGIFLIGPSGFPIVVWSNVIFDANGRILLGAWNYTGTTLVSTNQDPFTHDIDPSLFVDPDRVRALRVQRDGRALRIKQWYVDEGEPEAWAYDRPSIAGRRVNQVGVLVAHTGNNRGDIFLDQLVATDLTDPGGGWGGLTSILVENRERRHDEATAPPEACPNDGTPLEAGPRGELHCPWDGYVWTG